MQHISTKKRLLSAFAASTVALSPMAALAADDTDVDMNGDFDVTSTLNDDELSAQLRSMFSADAAVPGLGVEGTADLFGIVNTFERVGADADDDERKDMSDRARLLELMADVDWQWFFSHPCFHIASEEEREGCEDQFGAFANLRAALLNGLLEVAFMNEDLADTSDLVSMNVGTRASVEAQLEAEAEAAAEEDDGVRNSDIPRFRADRLWQRCGEKFGNRIDRSLCFQRNHHMVERAEADIEAEIR